MLENKQVDEDRSFLARKVAGRTRFVATVPAVGLLIASVVLAVGTLISLIVSSGEYVMGEPFAEFIVDLLKLLDLDSSLAARKELADELAVHEGADGSAEQNIALHRAVMTKLAENGGVVPDSLRD